MKTTCDHCPERGGGGGGLGATHPAISWLPARPHTRPPACLPACRGRRASLIAAAALDGARTTKSHSGLTGEILAHIFSTVGTPCPGVIMPFTCPREPHAPAHAKHHDTGNDRHSAREQPCQPPRTHDYLVVVMCSADPDNVRAHGDGH
jgi:hypothetical protein